MKRLVLLVLVAACGHVEPPPHNIPDASADTSTDAGANTCTFDQSPLDQCVLAP